MKIECVPRLLFNSAEWIIKTNSGECVFQCRCVQVRDVCLVMNYYSNSIKYGLQPEHIQINILMGNTSFDIPASFERRKEKKEMFV